MRKAMSRLLPEWVDRNLRVVLAARFAMSIGRAVAAVVTALYLAALGFSALEIGAIFVGVTVASALLSSTVGLMSDRLGRKPFLVVVPLLTAGAGLVYAESRAVAALYVAAAVGSFGRGTGAGAGNIGPYQPAEAALVAESAGAEHRSAAFGRIAFASSLGALVGGLLAELVRTSPHMTPAAATAAYRPAFLVAAALAVVAGALALLVREPASRRAGQPAWRAEAPAPPRRRVAWPRRSWPSLWRLWVTNGTNGVAIGLFGPFVSYWLHQRYGASPGRIGLLFALINLASLASTLSAAGVGRRLGTVRAIAGVRAVGGLLLVPMVLAPSFWAAGVFYLLRMVVQRVGLPLRQSFTQDLADPDERASVAALSNLPAQATMAGGQVLAGYLFDEVSLAAPFELAAAFQWANAALYLALFTWRPPGSAALLLPRLPGEAADGHHTRGGAPDGHGAEVAPGPVRRVGGDVEGGEESCDQVVDREPARQAGERRPGLQGEPEP